LRLPVLVGAALLVASAAAADEIEAPRVTLSNVNWAEAAASLTDHGIETPAAEFARLNAQTGKRFAGIGKSSVPVLLPIDIAAFRADLAAGKPDALNSDKYFGGFHPSKVFLPGPAGYFATFFFNADDFSFSYTRKPTEVTITGGAFVYDLDGPNHQEVFPVKELDDSFPGIRRILRDGRMRYAFERFGVPYVVSIQCYDRPPSVHYRSCKEAEPVVLKFMRMLHTAGGAPLSIAEPHVDLSRPQVKSSFSYFSPGNLIPDTGWHKLPGRADYHIYADMRFPIAKAPAFVKSQSFMPWGDCYRTGHSGTLGKKDAPYSCRVNGLPLVFDEAAPVNFSYPWRDNFCELRNFQVGQCPGGYGHQGEDIRPSTCLLENEQSDRCEPYQDNVAAVRGGLIWRNRGNLGLYILVNTANDFVRFRYLHMNPKFMDADNLVSGRQVSKGEIIGKVATWGDFKNGTSYHLHFNIQVFTKDGWVWVSPYMTLVHAYERLIGGRGTEIKPGEPVPPPLVEKPPIIAHPAPIPLPRPPPVLPTVIAMPKANPVVAQPEQKPAGRKLAERTKERKTERKIAQRAKERRAHRKRREAAARAKRHRHRAVREKHRRRQHRERYARSR
jgi:hypothetical protein